MKFLFYLYIILCSLQAVAQKGKLFIIGGGNRPPQMIERLVEEANLKPQDYVVIVPFASSEPDSAVFYARKQFEEYKLKVFPLRRSLLSIGELDSVRYAKLIYFTGGNQNQLMNAIRQTPLYEAIWEAYRNGATIAGTSAGAAIMSQKMITGNEKRYTNYQATFQSIEAENIEFSEGMGFLEKTIIDQHFIVRSRYNRLLSAVIEYPDYLCVGIDEATAILVKNRWAEVVGNSQVITLQNPKKSKLKKETKLGAKNLQISVYLPGEKFRVF